ncbi:hypothetical protein [Alkalilimnicola ehrlichii]|uniref:hypothetical protein n=1 Tax=Alkalilimnicola ehrlichii TaxID=351052 RepID=UPI003BA0FCDC
MESESQPGSSRQDGEPSRSTLVVLLHAFGKTPASLDDLVELLQRQPQYRDAEFFVPPLPLGYASLSYPVAIANEIVTGIVVRSRPVGWYRHLAVGTRLPPVNISTLATLAFVAAIWHVVTRL